MSAAADGRSLPLRRELQRKGIHLLTALVPIAYALGAPRRVIVVAMLGAAVMALVVEILRQHRAWAGRHFDALVGELLREHERARWAGATWLVLTFLVLALFFERSICIAAMWSVSTGDALAALVGRSAREFKRRLPRVVIAPHGSGGKTLIGSLACLVTIYVGGLLLARLSAMESAFAAVAATAAEWPIHVVDDNVRIAAAVIVAILLSRFVFS